MCACVGFYYIPWVYSSARKVARTHGFSGCDGVKNNKKIVLKHRATPLAYIGSILISRQSFLTIGQGVAILIHNGHSFPSLLKLHSAGC